MNEDLIRSVMDDEEVKACDATSYQIAIILAACLEFQRNQPKRSKSEKTRGKIMERRITIATEKLRKEIDDAYKNGYKPKLIFRPPEFIPIPEPLF